jgi:hypothetical protein
MRPLSFRSDALRTVLLRNKIATLDELKQALGTSVDVTIFRKLKPLDYLTSYSHRGRYYTLREIARFDDRGLWSQAEVWFSRFGTLLATAEEFVNRSPRGYFADELAPLLHVDVQDALLQLTQQQRLARQALSGRYLYMATEPTIQRRQLRARHSAETLPTVVDASVLEVAPDEVKAAILLFYSLLDEQQRRLYAGLESLKLGRGGDRQLADFLDLDPHTVARGRQQLLAQDVEVDRARRAGAGRKPVEKKTPEIIDAIEILLEHDTAGDPITGLKWTRKTTEKIAEVLQQIGIPVSANTVARLLYQMHFSLRVNRKQIATNSSPYRDQQFQHICSLRTRFRRQGLPIISVDSKKREMIGNFKQRRQVGPFAGPGERPRLPPRCQRSGHLLRHLRPSPQSRHRLRRHLSRHTGLRRSFHRHLVETRGNALLRPYAQTTGSCRLRRQQQLHFLGLEGRTPEAGM